MGDTVKIRQLRPGQRPGKDAAPETPVPSGLDRVVDQVRQALSTPGLTLEGDRNRGLDPYNSEPVRKTRDAWADRNRRR